MDLFGYSHYERLSRSAELSECGRYRWWLRRSWKTGGNGLRVCFVCLNPSVADGLADDPTVRRMMAYTQAWGYSRLDVRNLFALRATDPRELLTATEPTGGPRGDLELLVAKQADLVICAWGASVPFGRDREAVAMLRSTGKALHCLGLTKAGHPRHPLYAKADLQPIPFES